jgi:glycosyltransferase involved in cell wall biosynthesis
MACRLLETKGVADFVEAAELLKKRGVSARFLLAGSPDFSNPAAISLSQLSTWSDQGYVEILGHCSNMHSLISNSQVFCLPSYYPEGLPKVLCEAASSGRAVVTADEPGCRDAIENGLTGILVKSRDPVMLANVLEDLLHNKEILLSMGLAARKRAEELFDINVIVHQHLFIYSRLLNRAAP